nr:unnamed protein product [Digitaria exilis]
MSAPLRGSVGPHGRSGVAGVAGAVAGVDAAEHRMGAARRANGWAEARLLGLGAEVVAPVSAAAAAVAAAVVVAMAVVVADVSEVAARTESDGDTAANVHTTTDWWACLRGTDVSACARKVRWYRRE